MQHGEKQQGLGLAVAVTGSPGFLGRLRNIVPAVHAVGEITDSILDDRKGRRGAPLRVGLTSADLSDLLRERRARRNQSVRLIKRCEQRGNC